MEGWNELWMDRRGDGRTYRFMDNQTDKNARERAILLEINPETR